MKKRRDDDISFLGKAVLFFRAVKEKVRSLHLSERFLKKQRELSGYEGKNSPREAKTAYFLGIARACSITVLCILLAAVLLFGGSIFSYENVYYMFKDISYVSSFSESRPETLSFSQPFNNQDFATYKNGLAVAGDSEIKFFTSTGRTTLALGSSYTNPRICTSDAFVLIYDQGRSSYSVYNSFICLHSETLDYPISYADMSADGSFCIVTRSSDYGSVVRVYNSKFELDFQYFKNDHVISAELSPNGKYLAVISVDASMGESLVSLNLIKRGSTNPVFTETFHDVLPYKATFTSNDRIVLVCSESSSVYDLSGARKNHFVYPAEISLMSISEGGFAFLFAEDSFEGENTVTAFDRNGNLVYSEVLSGRINDMELSGDKIYLLFENEIRKIDTKFRGSVSRKITVEDSKLIVFTNGDVLLCTQNSAHYVSFND